MGLGLFGPFKIFLWVFSTKLNIIVFDSGIRVSFKELEFILVILIVGFFSFWGLCFCLTPILVLLFILMEAVGVVSFVI